MCFGLERSGGEAMGQVLDNQAGFEDVVLYCIADHDHDGAITTRLLKLKPRPT